MRAGSGRYVLHRLVRVKDGQLFIRGDAQRYCEGPFEQGDVLGRVTEVHSSGRVRRFDAGRWHLAGRAWQACVPLSVWLLHLTVRLRGAGKTDRI